MTPADLLTDSFERIRALFADIASGEAGLTRAEWQWRPDDHGNPIAWLLWHAARVQDDHVAGLAGTAQCWPLWQERVGIENDDSDIGYGHTAEQVTALQIDDIAELVAYQDAVHKLTLDYLAHVDEAELDRIVDEAWDPPVTAGARLVSVIGDCLQHLGQAAYVKGLV